MRLLLILIILAIPVFGAAPGMAITIVTPDGVECRGYGSMTSDTPHVTGSCSKAFTAYLAGKLLGWDYPAGDGLTVADLLSHTTGYPRCDELWQESREMERSELVNLLEANGPECDVGEQFIYNNIMYVRVSELLEEATGETYEALLDKHIFDPLGMTQTWASSADCITPAGGVVSTGGDMARWIEFLLVGDAVVDQAQTPQIHLEDGRGYGFGWFLEERDGVRVVSHGGYLDGFYTQVTLVPDRRLGFAVLTTDDGDYLDTVSDRLLDNLLLVTDVHSVACEPSA